MIYLDNAATTQMKKSLLKVYEKYSCENFFNPSAGYFSALENSKELENARKIILKKLGANKGDVIFTGSATEANNIAIKSVLREGRWEYIFSAGEHPSVYNVAKNLIENGKVVNFIPLLLNGKVDLDKLAEMVNEKTRLVSVMLVSNETGAVNDISQVCKIVKNRNPKALIHVDAVQGFCKIRFDISKWDIDFLSISAHKFHGPKGVGCLYIKSKAGLKPIVFGGQQEFGLRPGTENLAGIMAMAEACNQIDVDENYKVVQKLKDAFLSKIDLNAVKYISTESPYICSLSFPGVNGETLMRALENDVIIGTGSACSSKKAGNRVLEAMGYSKEYAKFSVRISFNAYQTEEEVVKAADVIMKKYKELLERLR